MVNSRPKRHKVRREDFSATIDYVIFIIRGFPLYTYSMASNLLHLKENHPSKFQQSTDETTRHFVKGMILSHYTKQYDYNVLRRKFFHLSEQWLMMERKKCVVHQGGPMCQKFKIVNVHLFRANKSFKTAWISNIFTYRALF